MAHRKGSVDISGLLKARGPMLTSEVAQVLKDDGVQSAAARQRTSRLPQDTTALKGVTFPKRKRFIFHVDDLGTGRYYRALEKAIHAESPPLSAALRALDCRQGIMPLSQFTIACGSPIRQKNQVSAERALAGLLSANLVQKIDVSGIGECLVRGGTGGISSERVATMRARLAAESFLLDAMAGWLSRMNMVSPHVVKIRGQGANPEFSTFEFDLCGPSYLVPLVHFKGGKKVPGFMVADVILCGELDEASVEPFLRKCTLLMNARGRRPFMPMLIAEGFTPEALNRCRSAGIMATRAETLFGRDVAMALGSLLEVLSSAAAVSPERLDHIFKRLSAIEGAAGNLRGALFEMVVSHMVTEIEGGSASIGVLLKNPQSGKCAEIDVLLRRQKQVTCYECKGHQPTNVTKVAEVERWVKDRLPTSYGAILEQHPTAQVTFEYWTCGIFDADALDFLSKAAASTKRYKISWKSGGEIRSYANGLDARGVKKHLADHFFSSPLTKAIA